MKLIVYELDGVVFQEITPIGKNQMISAIRPHLYKHLAPTGNLKIQVQDTNGRVIQESNTVAISDISSANYFHGYVRFDINIGLMVNRTYRIALVPSGGYTFSESAYIGWCGGFDLGKYEEDYTVNSTFDYGLDMEIWTLQEQTKGGAL